MGFSEEEGKAALAKYNGDVEKALNYLIGNN